MKTSTRIDDILELAERLPVKSRVNHAARIAHCLEHGHLIQLCEGDRIVGYAEVYILNSPPGYPVVPYPVNEAYGDYIYCWAAVCEKGYIRKLIETGKRTFNRCRWLCYHRRKRNNALHIERNEYYEHA